MKRILMLVGCISLIITGCSISLIGTPTPFVFPTAIALPSPTFQLTISGVPTLPLPSLTPAGSAPAFPTATTALTSTPAGILPGTPSGPYGVILIAPGDILNIRSGPGADNRAIGTFAPSAVNVMRTGPSAWSGGDLWVQVQNPSGGAGWVDSHFLTAYVAAASFCADIRVNTLITNLGHALITSSGAQLASLVSPAHGMDVRLYRNGAVVNYDQQHARFVFDSTYEVDWGPAPGSGLETVGAFHAVVLPKLLDVFNAPAPGYTLSCDEPQTGGASYDTSWPLQYANLNFYSVYKPGSAGQELAWRTILVGVEFVQGQPYVFSLTQLEWEP